MLRRHLFYNADPIMLSVKKKKNRSVGLLYETEFLKIDWTDFVQILVKFEKLMTQPMLKFASKKKQHTFDKNILYQLILHNK